MNSPLRIAVIGGGHLGTIHARLLQQVPHAELVAIVEPHAVRAAELSSDFQCEIVTEVDAFASRASIDAAVIAAPTTFHHELGTRLLGRGIHCLIEKPLATTPVESRSLVLAARRGGCVLQVGHVERFNPAWTTIRDQMSSEPRFIEATREGTLTFRSMDAGVVLDLMIHDIDLVLSLVKSPVAEVQAHGFHWTGPSEDIAQARLIFASGCVAQLSASRVSSGPRRQMRVYGTDWFSDVDFAERACQIVAGPMRQDWQRPYNAADRERLMAALYDDVLTKRDLIVPDANPILDELSDFVTSIMTKTTPIVTGEDGAAAVDIAHEVIEQIQGGGEQHYRKAG